MTVAGLCCLVLAIVATGVARSALTRPPTAAERATAQARAIARRWESWPAGKIFPATLAYSTDLLTQEKATRIGIAAEQSCAAALDPAAAVMARHDGCRAALRATYLGELQGVVFTTGVVVFGTPSGAAAFTRAVRQAQPAASGHGAGPPVPGLRALGLAGTASALFDGAARQAMTMRQAGPYVVMTVAGYADGRPASVTGQRLSVFAPGADLTGEVLAPLVRPVTVNCASKEWSC